MPASPWSSAICRANICTLRRALHVRHRGRNHADTLGGWQSRCGQRRFPVRSRPACRNSSSACSAARRRTGTAGWRRSSSRWRGRAARKTSAAQAEVQRRTAPPQPCPGGGVQRHAPSYNSHRRTSCTMARPEIEPAPFACGVSCRARRAGTTGRLPPRRCLAGIFDHHLPSPTRTTTSPAGVT